MLEPTEQELARQQAFGERVRNLRKAQKLSQEKLAEMAGFHRTYIGSVEGGNRNLSLLNIYRIAEALNVDAGSLL